jgi:hypothetical protein
VFICRMRDFLIKIAIVQETIIWVKSNHCLVSKFVREMMIDSKILLPFKTALFRWDLFWSKTDYSSKAEEFREREWIYIRPQSVSEVRMIPSSFRLL